MAEAEVPRESPAGTSLPVNSEQPPQENADVEMMEADQSREAELQLAKERHANRSALVRQALKPAEEADKYRQVTNWRNLLKDFVEEDAGETADLDLSDIKKQLEGGTSASYKLFHEIVLDVRYTPDHVSKYLISRILDGVICGEGSQQLQSAFLSVLNMFEMNDSVMDVIREVKHLNRTTVGKYFMKDLHVQNLLRLRDFERRKQTFKRALLDLKKYNLRHESSEGYAKVIVLLSGALRSETACFEINYIVESVQSLIGHFNLDPLRVLEDVLSIGMTSSAINYKFLVDFLKASPWWPRGNVADPSSLQTLDIGGNEQAAVILGHMIQSSTRSTPTIERLDPSSRIFISVLIKEGFISFGSLYRYIEPSDDEMERLSETISERIENEILAASASQLALSGPLTDDADDLKETTESEKPVVEKEEGPSFNAKVEIFKAFLANGLYYPVIFLLARYPMLAFVDDESVNLALRLLNHMVWPLKEQVKPLSSDRLSILSIPKTPALRSREPYLDPIIRERSDKNFESSIYVYEEWTKLVPVIENVNDLLKYSNEFFAFLGARIGDDPMLISLLSKVALRDLVKYEGTDEYDQILQKWFSYAGKFILPASSFITDNPIAAHDMYSFLKKFPMDWRFNLYGGFQMVTAKNQQYVRLNYSRASKSTKDILKRLTKENVKVTMRRLSKITFANPLPAFAVIIGQIESYVNLVDLLVEAARYFTEYAWDVLVFTLLTRLTQSRQAIQNDGLNDALWLQAISTFIAKLAKNYTDFDFRAIITFSLKSLHSGNSIGLTIIRDLVYHMGGIQMYTNLAPAQIKFLNFSRSLQQITRKVINDTRDDSQRSGCRLVKTLVDSDHVSELLVLLSQYGQKVLNDADEGSHFKFITDRADQCSSVLYTYIQLLTFFSSSVPDLFSERIVGVNDLIKIYGVSVEWAFELWRGHIPIESQIDLDPSLLSVGSITKELYLKFWHLSLYDIYFDADIYDKEQERLEKEDGTLTAEIKITKMTSRFDTNDDIKENLKLRNTLQKKKDFNASVLASLADDKSKHLDHYETVQKVLLSSKPQWFTDATPTDEEINSFIQSCVIPRSLQTGSGAVFTSSFVNSVLDQETSSKILEKILAGGILVSLLYTLTSYEAENLGIFVNQIFGYYSKVDAPVESKKTALAWMKNVLDTISATLSETDEYLSRRNTFTFLKNLIPEIRVDDIGEAMREVVEETANSETRDDLKLAASAIVALLQSASKNWIHAWEFLESTDDEKELLLGQRQAVLKKRMQKKSEEKRIAQVKEQEEEIEKMKAREILEEKEQILAAEKRKKQRAEDLAKWELEDAKAAELEAIQDATMDDSGEKQAVSESTKTETQTGELIDTAEDKSDRFKKARVLNSDNMKTKSGTEARTKVSVEENTNTVIEEDADVDLSQSQFASDILKTDDTKINSTPAPSQSFEGSASPESPNIDENDSGNTVPTSNNTKSFALGQRKEDLIQSNDIKYKDENFEKGNISSSKPQSSKEETSRSAAKKSIPDREPVASAVDSKYKLIIEAVKSSDAKRLCELVSDRQVTIAALTRISGIGDIRRTLVNYYTHNNPERKDSVSFDAAIGDALSKFSNMDLTAIAKTFLSSGSSVSSPVNTVLPTAPGANGRKRAHLPGQSALFGQESSNSGYNSSSTGGYNNSNGYNNAGGYNRSRIRKEHTSGRYRDSTPASSSQSHPSGSNSVPSGPASLNKSDYRRVPPPPPSGPPPGPSSMTSSSSSYRANPAARVPAAPASAALPTPPPPPPGGPRSNRSGFDDRSGDVRGQKRGYSGDRRQGQGQNQRGEKRRR